ncbi:hypothetical protein NJI34_28575 [Pseudomonas sp. S 311-6]|uniref:hypothetical protein n=1 Tax=Pseudomonas TaxID=286 RepID=UPI002097BECA|nr:MULTISPECIES: hypothetical protein [Pseudomonas]MCO7566425.1 hypothetical protein [Pseudomonas mosselii]MCO7617453.1 hypothetical protein [Pseudomonas guariconensis]MCO7640731.1 hypothetical protein [Pseudomonas sp. S 311-6]
MDTNKMRAAFEAMILADGKSIRRCGDSYHFGTIHRKWLFWQEAWRQSREAVVVELPKIFPDESVSSVHSKCVRAIEAQGLKVEVKP